ncbi:alpha/beta hydrolase [Paenibacillus sacheonensis]|uniref:AB hydrolase-1 domain-containing protein n=1 Tax=Paenibacillus sacheonensis TaxID=742054 RepID=A0A7X5BWW3_9BACL|nr:alpha/beta fold hydrolase [Paenibacillus sacheonensis]MBM7563928.1 dienelactone hydrolase [Paenibacillus sacheonensis]NBC67726.1 hypothetical protein [Paenibacillus sacheonensis]
MNEFRIQHGTDSASHIPVIWAAPAERLSSEKQNLVIWLTGFTGKKEGMIPQLEELARAGYTAVSFDLREHGDRTVGSETHPEMRDRVNEERRLYFWPIIAMTAEDISRVIDWAVRRFGIAGRILAGGISMGGDIALTAAGIDRRIDGVCAAIATPDWLRPGSVDPQGESDTYSQLLYDRYDPITNVRRYAHRPWIHFENAGADSYVPPEAARRFRELLLAGPYADSPERIGITEHPGLDHGFPPEMWQGCLAWFRAQV